MGERRGERLANERSALVGFNALDGPVKLVERAGLGALLVRGSGSGFLAAVGRVLGVPLPGEPNTTQGHDEVLALWLGPDEWLVRMPARKTETAAAALHAALAPHHAAVVDVSDRACLLRLSGLPARDVLAQGCPLDLHPRGFRPGSCARSRFLKAPVFVHQVDARPMYDLETPRSYARYLWDCLVEASRDHAHVGDSPGCG